MERKFTDVAAADGTAIVRISSEGNTTLIIQQISTSVSPLSSAPAGSTATISKNGIFITRTIPTGGVASGLPYVDLDPKVGDEITVDFTGLTPGALCTENVIYELKEE